MATSSEQAPLPPSGGPPRGTTETAGRLVEYEEFIESQLQRTRSHVWSVDFAGALMTLVAGTLAYFFLAAVVDHWIVPGGLGIWGRLLLFVGYVTAAAVYLFRQVLPLLLRRINPLYAAHTIERSRPTLKNALVNFLMFRANPSGLSAVVYEGIEAQAATHLARAPLEAAVDRSKLVRIGYALVAILLASAIYAVLSPKDLFQTVGRVAMPWARIDPPTRTTITEIEPGDVQAFRGQQVTVKARVDGLGDDAQVRLLFTTDDGQSVDRVVEMALPPDGYKHVGTLPGGDGALQQSLKYRIVAGDAASGPHRIEVVAAPTIVVRSVEYKYPSYTGLVAERVEHQGDIKAIEGTEITVHAVANQPIASAYLDFDCDQKLDDRMRADGERASATFTASLARDRHSYQLIFKNETGQQNPQPVRHQIEVTRDLAPEIQFVGPKPDELDLPANGAVDLEVVANDPDFALRTVRLSATSGGKSVVDSVLLDEAWRGQFVRKVRFEPRKLGLKPGDTVAYRATAEDTRQPAPNRTETAERRIRIVSPSERARDKDRLAKRDQRGGDDPQGAADGPGGGDDEHPRAGDAAPDEKPAPEPQDAQPRDDAPARADDPQSPEPGQDERPANDAQQDAGAENREGQSQQDAADGGQSGDPSAQLEQDGVSGRDDTGQGDGAKSQKKVGQRAEPGSDARETAANDGSNDRDAIERILEHRGQQNKATPPAGQQQPGQRKQEQSPPSQQRPAAGDEQQPGDAQESAPQPGQDREAANKKPSQGREESQGKQGQKSASPRDDQSADGRPDGSDPTAAPQDNKGKGQSGDSNPGNQDPQRDAAQRGQGSQNGKGSPADKPESADDQQPGDAPQPGDNGPGQQGKQPSDRTQPDASRDAAESEPGDKPADRRAGSKGERGDASQDKSGQGTRSEDDGTAERKPPSSRQGDKSDTKVSTGEKEKGNSGAGKSDPNKQGSPSPQGKQQPRDKSPRDGAGETPNKPGETPQSPSTSQRESNSEGQDDGDRSGGGKKGGGQKANKPGTGGAGQNTAADDGAGRSEEKGNGETSDRAGEDREAEGQTGKSGSTRGQGSRSAPASDDKAEPMGSSGEGAPPSEPGQGGQGKAGPSAANPAGGGQPGQGPTAEQKWRPTDDKADAANLEYARKATDLALAHLKDELKKERPDPRLLERLGWTRGDLEQFVKRWEQMRDQAQSPGEKGASARRELDDALRSLGLRPRATSLESNSARDDKSQGYKESRRTSPPPEYAEQYKAYTQGTAKGGK